ncbi:MAG: ATP synthase F0 subcomplex subunit OSCP atp5 [Peltula sp. TS41687]|nr:MAG: ATP synthase F0 subcomplex subunit OSCP atp5 [Peltula sp. TS41687]
MLSTRLIFQAPSRILASRGAAIARLTPATLRGGRNYAQAATPTSSQQQQQQSFKPPVPLFGIDGTYANALYTAAAKTSSLDQAAKALASLAELLKKDRKLPAILSAPTLSATDKNQIVNELLKHIASADKGNTIKNFLKTLADNNRLGILQGVCEKFATLISVHRGEVECLVTSAAPLENKVLSRLESAVAKSEYVGPGKKLKVTNKVNSDILGGLIVELGGRTIDLSVSSKIARMNKLLTDVL